MLRMGTKAWVGESIWVAYKVYDPYNEYMNMGIQHMFLIMNIWIWAFSCVYDLQYDYMWEWGGETGT